MTKNLDNIPESKAARWAFRLAYIPILGVPIFIILGLIALLSVGNNGKTGLNVLTKGSAVFLLNLVLCGAILIYQSEWFNDRYYYNFQKKYDGEYNDKNQKHGTRADKSLVKPNIKKEKCTAKKFGGMKTGKSHMNVKTLMALLTESLKVGMKMGN